MQFCYWHRKEQANLVRLLFCFFWITPISLNAQFDWEAYPVTSRYWINSPMPATEDMPYFQNLAYLSEESTVDFNKEVSKLSSTINNKKSIEKLSSNGKLLDKEVAIGYSMIHEKLPEGYNYTPLFITARKIVYQFLSKKRHNFNIFVEPQFVLNNAPANFPTTFEFGANLGIQYFLPLSSKNGIAFSISAGPHYLSLETEMQAKGFIFSDNFELAYYHLVGKQLGISIKPRFRHISNAGLQSPNIGIDNLFLMVGLFWKN